MIARTRDGVARVVADWPSFRAAHPSGADQTCEHSVAVIRAFNDEEFDRAAGLSLNDDTPLTCQFMLEDHAVRHSYHHMTVIRKALNR